MHKAVQGAVIAVLALCAGLVSGCGDYEYPPVLSTHLELQDQSGNTVDTFAPGETVTMVLRITNESYSAVSVEVTAQQFDFIVAGAADKSVVWQWSNGQVFPAEMDEIHLAAGETRDFEVTWEQNDNGGAPVPAGDYLAQGFLATTYETGRDGISKQGETRSRTVAFTVN